MTSFRKRTVQKPIRGTRTSPHTGQVITSSGNPSLDLILGGGLPIGSICLIEEDRFMTHAKVLVKYFLAEGLLSKQELFLGSLDDSPAEMLRRLPKPLTDEEIEQEQRQEQEQQADKNGLRIAFRYNDLPLVNSEQATAKIGHHFNLMEHMDAMMLSYGNAITWNDKKTNELTNPGWLLDPIESMPYSYAQAVGSKADSEQSPPDAAAPEAAAVASPEAAVVAFPEAAAVASPEAAAAAGETEATPMEQSDGQKTASNINNNNNNNMDNSTANNTTSTTGTTTTTTPTASPSTGKPQFFYNARYDRLLNYIQLQLNDPIFEPGANMQEKNLCRVCLTSLGSPLWYDDHFAEDLLKFLTILRGSVRSYTAVCFITMPMHLIAKYDSSLVPKIRQLVDYAIELESFAGSERETHPAFKEYSGLLHLHKMTAINTLAVHMPETTDLAFKLRRKKFVIEKLHLPPDLQESTEQTAKGADVLPMPNCGVNSNVSMDF
ncbi:hypothetical protein AWZ03_004442 [Drosophila navojoa]|uniref:Elongator complex protein 4 n=1 Tax=Drosophila navojoa TaxID=7232 RepID=A0A484BLR0_DRONA|nr:putative elongator complex protein 4 [Drosophila navojoa]TDG49142.1 hypothetical protein AWZ03_004442 [Drosophila navojoa]